MREELKPCPFCGDPMQYSFDAVRHVKQGDCVVGAYSWGSHDAVERWNRRAALAAYPFTYCDGCSGHDCDAERGCAYPGVVPRPAPTVEPVTYDYATLIADLRRLVDSQTGGDALVLVQRQLFNHTVGRLAALVAERDEARERTNAAIEDYNDALAALATANARIAGLEKALAEVRGHIADVAVAGMLIGDDQAETHTRLREKGKAMLAIVDAALTGGEDA